MKKKLLLGLVVVLITIVVFGTPSYADSPLEHKGFYLRMQLGIADANSKGTEYSDGLDTEVSGIASVIQIDVGGAIKENLILFGTLRGITTLDPDYRKGNFDFSSSVTSYNFSDMGIGITYYFMPTNFFIGGSLNIEQNNMEIKSNNETDKFNTDNGFGLNLNVGKEWWVSDNWGLGVALFGEFGNVPDAEGKIKNIAYGLLFSATFN